MGNVVRVVDAEPEPWWHQPNCVVLSYNDVGDAMSLHHQLRRLREDVGMSLRELARRTGIDASALSRYERGRKTPRADTVETIAAALGMEVAFRPARSANARFVDALSRLQAEAVSADPTLLDRAREALDRLEGRSASAEEWRRVLDAGPRAVVGVLTSVSPDVQALKSDSPLAFVVEVSDERRRELAEAAREA
jgi:transcriptional regulator with XRE-family HTH domain